MPSFDIISKVNFQEFDNAVANCLREVDNRYDFKGFQILIERSFQKHLYLQSFQP